MDPFLNNDWQNNRPSDESLQMDLVTELQDNGFEPQTRARSNTWPLPRPENFVEPTDEVESTKASNQQLATDGQTTPQQNANSKKNSSRRNAWGNLSYADLITHAIGSASDKRLTLSQIYEWMVQNVPYFKDKGDSNSSAGWKNSIRHNLSLHNRFMRVQNEGTGKSSWWMLNPDAKPGKSVRRRAASMETSKYEKRRGRAKKRVEALRNAGITGINDATPSPCSSVSEGLDHFPESPLHSFQLSPDFRQRASSNASSCGRLSPIPAALGLEPDWGYTPSTDYQNSTITPAQSNALDQLAGSLADDLTLQKELFQGFSNASGLPNQPPPPYQPPQPLYQPPHPTVAQSYAMQQNQCPLHRSLPCTCLHNSREGLSPSSGTGMSPSYPHSEPSSDSLNRYTPLDSSLTQQQLRTRLDEEYNLNNAASTLIGQCMEALNNQTQIDDFNIESFHGGLECNIEELIQQELSIDGLLDIQIPLTTTANNQNFNGTTTLTNNQTSNSQQLLLNNSPVTIVPTSTTIIANNLSTTLPSTTRNNNNTLTQIDLHQNDTVTTTMTNSLTSSPTTKVQLSQTATTLNAPPSWVH